MKQSAGAVISAIIFSGLAGCGGQEGEGQQGGQQQMPTNVIVAEAVAQDVTDSISLVGTLNANERVQLQSEIAGFIREIHFEEGQVVEQGQLLIKLDDTKLTARLRETEANFKLAENNYKRYQQLHRDNTVSQQELEEFANAFDSAQATLEVRQQEVEDSEIRAPFSGVMGTREISPGQFVSTQQNLTTMVDIDPLKADFDVPERFLSELEIGQKVGIGISAYPEENFEGTVYFIAPVVSETDRTVLVRALLPNDDRRLKPGMFGSLSLVLNVREDAVVIPESAIIQQSASSYVMVANAENLAERRAVETGIRLPGKVEITSGLEVGERVVVEGHQKIGPGSLLNPLDSSAGLPARDQGDAAPAESPAPDAAESPDAPAQPESDTQEQQ